MRRLATVARRVSKIISIKKKKKVKKYQSNRHEHKEIGCFTTIFQKTAANHEANTIMYRWQRE